MYSKGMSTRDISNYVKEMYAVEISHITDKAIPAMNEWPQSPLDPIYPFVFLDCMFYKVKENGSVTTGAVYNILGINREGKKDLLGIYHAESEGAKFWLTVLTELKKRGVEDI